jgi:hypothetical protein
MALSSKIPAFANPIVTASVIANIFLFFIIFPVIMPKLAPKNPELTGLNFFDDIGNGIAGAADDVADFTVDAVDATVDAAGDVSIVIVNGLTTVGNLANGENPRNNWIQKDN